MNSQVILDLIMRLLWIKLHTECGDVYLDIIVFYHRMEPAGRRWFDLLDQLVDMGS